METRCIAVIGAECTGKSTLCEAMASALPAWPVHEALREFCAREGRTPRADEQAALIDEQLAREQAAMAHAQARGLAWVVVDSTPLATALYSQALFGDNSLIDAALRHQHRYALTLLTDVDLPWEADGIQRDGPGARADFHARLVRSLAQAAIAPVRVAGDPAQRLAMALRAVLA